jgi:membrane-bound lytic murein transglycosylase D
MNHNESQRLLAAAALLCGALLAGCINLEAGGVAQTSVSTTAASIDMPTLDAIRLRRLTLRELPEPGPGDLLERLRRGFELAHSDEESVARELAWYASHPGYLDRVFERADRYLFYIAEALAERGMPSDLALLPVIESAFDPFAYSHGRAAGLWQIIPSTGRRLDLKQNWWFDARRDLYEATRAALDYLEALHSRFDGDWLLAVAGYNSGEANVERAVRRAEAAGEATDFWHIRRFLPRETRTYVPRLLAIRDLVAAPAAHDIALREIANEPRLALVPTRGQIDMALAASLAGLEVGELYRLNPAVNRWATDPDGPHRLVVPIDKQLRLTRAIDELGERERVQWTRHRIEPGDTLNELARSYQTTPELLRSINALPGNLIRAGDYLMIPHALESLSSYSESLDARNARQRDRERSGRRRVHVVRRGESLWTISRRYDVGLRALASWNAMAPGDVLSVGRELVIWSNDPVAQPAAFRPPENRIRKIDYVVRRGDSLAAIARRFSVTLGQLLEWNEISVEQYLQPGQRLVMFVDVAEQSS